MGATLVFWRCYFINENLRVKTRKLSKQQLNVGMKGAHSARKGPFLSFRTNTCERIQFSASKTISEGEKQFGPKKKQFVPKMGVFLCFPCILVFFLVRNIREKGGTEWAISIPSSTSMW